MATKKKKRAPAEAIVNKRARFDYTLGDELTVGLSLNGKEVRAARDGRVQLKDSFVTIRNKELWINNASFSLVLNEKGENIRTVDTEPRKLLASRKQIDALEHERQTGGMTIVPLRLLTRGKFIKLVIALGKGKRNYDKRETIKRRDIDREQKRMISGR